MMATVQSKSTVSAGGIVLNPHGMVLVVNQRGTSWSLPKGHIDPGEEALAAAKREIMEESGVTNLKFIKFLGVYGRYKIGLKDVENKHEWKTILFYLFKSRQINLKPLDPHNPEARWVHPDEVDGLLTHPKDKAFYRSIKRQFKTHE